MERFFLNFFVFQTSRRIKELQSITEIFGPNILRNERGDVVCTEIYSSSSQNSPFPSLLFNKGAALQFPRLQQTGETHCNSWIVFTLSYPRGIYHKIKYAFPNLFLIVMRNISQIIFVPHLLMREITVSLALLHIYIFVIAITTSNIKLSLIHLAQKNCLFGQGLLFVL